MLTQLRKLKRRLGNYLAPPLSTREILANKYLRGEGLEVGALHNPLRVPPAAHVRYVDRIPIAELREHYPELNDVPLVPLDIIDDGQILSTVPDASQDFVIANHFIEHCEDPIRTLINHFRVLKVGGVLYLAVPDKRFTFDKLRPVTPIAHLRDDFENGPERSRRSHFEEWVRLVIQTEGEEQIQAKIQDLMTMNYSIHFHVWTSADFLEFLLSLRSMINFEVETMTTDGEILVILKKSN